MPSSDFVATGMDVITQEAAQAAHRGAAHLDEVKPGWHRSINVFTLDIASKERCIVGQLCGYYTTDALVSLGVFTDTTAADLGFARRFVFDFPALTSAWMEEIWARQRADQRAAAAVVAEAEAVTTSEYVRVAV